MRGRPVCGICMCPYGDDGDCACKKEGTTMTTLHEAAQQALEALGALLPMFEEWHEDFPDHVGDKEAPALNAARAAIESLRSALAQQGEPETWTDDGGWTFPVERQIIQTR